MAETSRRLFCITATMCMGSIAAFGRGVSADPSIAVSRLYFIPFEATTFVPVTPGNIEEAATLEISLIGPERGSRRHPFVTSFRALVESRAAKTQLNDLAVRLKLVLEEGTYYVDAAGGVLEVSSKRTFRLQKADLKWVEKSIEGFAGVVDMKAFSRAHGELAPPK